MSKILRAASVVLTLVLLSVLPGQSAEPSEQDREALYAAMHPKAGKVLIANDLVELNIGPGFKYLDNTDATTFLVRILGNPPSAVEGNLGVIVPTKDDEDWFAVLSYSADGHVNDDDAAGINYDDLLKQMQQATDKDAEDRRNQGFAGLKLLGWAQKPYYDSVAKKIYWAKSIQFDGQPKPTLNYDVRILGRTGYLNIKIVDDMPNLDKLNAEMPQILGMANFTSTNTYSNFIAGTDHTAAYGIAGLVAGGILAKAGFFKGLLLLAAAFWKIIAVAVLGFFAAVAKSFRKIFSRNSA